MNTSLVLKSEERYPGNVYEPQHVRRVFFDAEANEYTAQATIGDDIVVEVTASDDLDAWMTLSTRLVDVFRAMRAAA